MTIKALEQRDLAVQAYEYLLENTETFEMQDIGADLAYLMGAILNEGYVEFFADQPVVSILKKGFPQAHALWAHIRFCS